MAILVPGAGAGESWWQVERAAMLGCLANRACPVSTVSLGWDRRGWRERSQGKRMKVCDPMLGVVTERSWLPKPCFIPAKTETSEQIGDLSWGKIGFMR